MIFRIYIVYNKHEMIKIGTQNREISQILSQVGVNCMMALDWSAKGSLILKGEDFIVQSKEGAIPSVNKN